MRGYTGEGANSYSFLTSNQEEDIYTVLSYGWIHEEKFVNNGLVVRLRDDKIIIDYDMNDKTLYDALIQAGVPSEQIICAYAGEPAPVP